MAENENSNPADELFTTKEAAKFLRITPVFLYQLTGMQKIPAHRLGGKLLFIKSELLDFVKEH